MCLHSLLDSCLRGCASCRLDGRIVVLSVSLFILFTARCQFVRLLVLRPLLGVRVRQTHGCLLGAEEASVSPQLALSNPPILLMPYDDHQCKSKRKKKSSSGTHPYVRAHAQVSQCIDKVVDHAGLRRVSGQISLRTKGHFKASSATMTQNETLASRSCVMYRPSEAHQIQSCDARRSSNGPSSAHLAAYRNGLETAAA